MSTAQLLTDSLEKPALDDRSYRVIELPNKLEAMLVHDPETDKASAAMDVNVGAFSDADDMPGMAHAVEHLLFMGTEKYPQENAYNQYLAAHSGYSNAFTAATSTNYFFEVAAASHAPDGEHSTNTRETSPLYGALDRFAQFFIAPLFLEETLDRELRAVDSENKKNLQSDPWRLHQLSKSLSNPEHPYCHFSTGNLQTLRDEPRKRGIDVRKEFMKFHEREYSANRMRLVVLGRDSLDDLEDWVVELFSGVRNKDLPQNRWDHVQPLTKDQLLTQISAKPVMEMRSLDIVFPYMDDDDFFMSQPSRYISHLIGHEGPGSILAYIKAKGWANGLASGPMPLSPGSAFFTVSIRLTENGLDNYLEVVKVVFQYIAMIRKTPPQEWIVEEIQKMNIVDFRFKQKTPASSFTSKLSQVMQKRIPREWLLSGSRLIREYDPNAISKGLSFLRPDNFRMSIISQTFPGNWDQREKWYGTEYRSDNVSQEFLDELARIEPSLEKTLPTELHLPHRNEFIPTKLEVEKWEVSEPSKAPKLLRHDDKVRIWWKKDDQFWVPKANVFITLRTPLAYTTPECAVKTKLFCELVRDSLAEYSYDAEIAGLEYSLSSNSIGIDIEVSGYNDKIPVLLEKVLTSMRDLEVKPDRFHIIQERLLRGFRNVEYHQPFQRVGEFSRWLNSEKSWINEQYLAELPHLTPEDIRTFFPNLLRQVHVEALVHGNLYRDDALKLTDLVEATLKPRPLPQSQWHVRRSLLLPQGCNYIYPRALKDPANINNCIEYLLFIGENPDRALRAKLLLLAQLAEEPAFDQLRTKEQLGYVVFSGLRLAATTMSYRILIQSERTPEYLEQRINSFLIQLGKELEEKSVEDFEKLKRSLINKRLEKVKNLNQESDRFWNHIGNEYYDFEQVDYDVAHLKPVTKDEVLSFFHHYIHPSSPTRAKLSVHLLAQTSPHAIAEKTSPAEQLEQLLELLQKSLPSLGVEVQADKLRRRFDGVKLANGQDGIVSAIKNYLSEDLQMQAEPIEEILAQGKQLLAMALPSLGIEVSHDEQLPESKTDPATDTVKNAVIIDNVYEFKARLAVSHGAAAVKPLGEFEENDPKL
ncbi:LuxS/MPP-like metallohydrolase [Xylona heveae TC161]|uniref:LuxS/MPP-like metallohydrolase n=1 Tax=Xylona heveae (strain CBS 132557 / TC161) TaxID=1328760 RepID=A0A165AAA3_XYLHT|nr:LuxS/MPP-like metallohydrolase [Xylona heveae TC161]KZF20164.1 LuxS/MPP-like metallohydrolase [Xylona heveae TC161]